MPFQRRHVRIPASIALVALAAFAVLWMASRTQLVRGVVERWIADATGLPASIETLRLGIFPAPGLRIDGLRIAQPPGFGDEPLLDIGHLRLRLTWGNLFGGSRVHAVEASDAAVRLIVGADGASNWSKLFPADGVEGAGGDAVPAEPSSWRLGALALERGTIHYRDEAANSRWQLTAITVAAADVAPGTEFPLELSLGGVFGANTMHYAVKGRGRIDPEAGSYEAKALEYRGWLGGEPLPLAGAELTGALKRASYEDATGVARLEAGRFEFGEVPGSFEGTLDLDEPALVARLRVATEPFAPRASALIFGHPLPVTTDPAVFESLQLALEAHIRDGELALDPVSGRLDDTHFDGRILPGGRLIRANLDRIDLNRYLPPAAKSANKKKATLEAAVAELGKLDVDAEIRIGEARVAGAKMRDAVIRVERNGEQSR
jgi:AsmA protein